MVILEWVRLVLLLMAGLEEGFSFLPLMRSGGMGRRRIRPMKIRYQSWGLYHVHEGPREGLDDGL